MDKKLISIIVIVGIIFLGLGFSISKLIYDKGDVSNENLAGGTTKIKNNLTVTGTFNADGTLTASGAFTAVGTTTLTQSVDGLVAGGTILVTATGTVRTIYENTTGPKFCDANVGFLYIKSNGSYAPSLIWSVGTSTSASASKNLIASSTIATTSTTLLPLATHKFVLAQGEFITAIFSDITNNEASTTHFSNLTAEAGVWCQDVSI